MIKLRNAGFASVFAITAASILVSGIAYAGGIAVLDDEMRSERNKDEKNNDSSKVSKADETGQRKAVVCTYSNKYRGEMFRRSPAQAIEHSKGNVSLIRYYAKKYGISEGLAMSVSYQEARFDSCAGSHTGVKGAMQLTKRTGQGLGFDRDINEQNIEGGVKLLSMGAKKCGETNYTCLASYYNGSNATEQANWAAGVGRWHGYFNNYASSGQAPAAAPPPFSIATSGVAGTGNAQKGAVKAVNNAAAGLETSVSERAKTSNLIDALSGGIGTQNEYMDAWDENTQARSMNAQLINDLIKTSALLNDLVGSRLQMKTTALSESSKSLSSDGTENPFSCDPVILRKLKIDPALWRDCALSGVVSSGDELLIVPDASAAANALSKMQNNLGN